MKRSASIFLTIILIVMVLVAVFFWWQDRQQYETTDNAYLKRNMVLISSKVPGFITELLFDDNQAVKKNQLLVKIDPRDYQARVNQAKAQITATKAGIQRLEAGKQVQRAIIDSIQANIRAAQARLAQINKDLKRFNNLIKRGSATTQALDKIKTQQRLATAELSSVRSRLLAEKSKLNSLDIEELEAQAKLKMAEAQYQLALLDLENTQVKAPFDGIIGHRGVQTGQLVRPGLALAFLIDNQEIWLEANFKETQLARMKKGQPVQIKIDAFPDKEFNGRVDSFAPATGSEFSILPPENATGNFTKIVRRIPVKIVFDKNQDLSRLKNGLSAEVRVKVL